MIRLKPNMETKTLRNEDLEFCPTLSPAGQAMLDFMREHPAAPIYRNRSGNRLKTGEVAMLRAFVDEVLDSRPGWPRGDQPDWLDAFLQETFRDVPYFRAFDSPPARLTELPTTSRADLAADIARFVPDTVPTERLINFRTTGTTGHPPLATATHPA